MLIVDTVLEEFEWKYCSFPDISSLVEPVARIGDPESHTVELLNVDF